MATTFTELPIVDLAPLRSGQPTAAERKALATQLYEVFTTVGFAYLIRAPLSVSEAGIFDIAREFFAMDEQEKMKVAKRTFRKHHRNTYRGYFPAQAGSDNLKEGFEIGSAEPCPPPPRRLRAAKPSASPFQLTEPNVFPPSAQFPSRAAVETLYRELQALGTTLLSLLASSLGRPATSFTRLLHGSVSTLRLLHYPPSSPDAPRQELCCTPHTDSGLLTLLHQDPTGGLEVRNSAGAWIPAPYVSGSVVVNIGDLMAQMSGGRFVATEHRVRSAGRERYSVPFFCEPGVDAMVGEPGKEIRYEDFVVGKMGLWVEFQDPVEVEAEQDDLLMQGARHEMSVGA